MVISNLITAQLLLNVDIFIKWREEIAGALQEVCNRWYIYKREYVEFKALNAERSDSLVE